MLHQTQSTNNRVEIAVSNDQDNSKSGQTNLSMSTGVDDYEHQCAGESLVTSKTINTDNTLTKLHDQSVHVGIAASAKLFQGLEFQPLDLPFRSERLEKLTKDKIMSYTGALSADQLDHVLALCAHLGFHFYWNQPEQVQLMMSVYSIFLFCLDDKVMLPSNDDNSFSKKDLEMFLHYLLARGPLPSHPFFKGFVDFMGELYDFLSYEPMFAALAVSSANNFVIAILIELNLVSRDFKILPTAASPKFPYFLRTMSGNSIPYALLAFTPNKDGSVAEATVILQVLPDISRFAECCNDICSYRKEENEGEKINMINCLALARGIKTEEVPWQIVDEAIEISRNVDAVLKPYPLAKIQWENFRRGKLNWYLTEPRYVTSEDRQFLLSSCQ